LEKAVEVRGPVLIQFPGSGSHGDDGRAAGSVEGVVLRDSLEELVPPDHLLRSIDRFVELSSIRRQLAPYHSPIGRPSIDSELMIRMMLIGCCCGIRSERRLCDEVHLNASTACAAVELDYAWARCSLRIVARDVNRQPPFMRSLLDHLLKFLGQE